MEQKLVKKFTPQTGCEKVKREMCAPPGCGLVEVRYVHIRIRMNLCTRNVDLPPPFVGSMMPFIQKLKKETFF